MAGTQPALTPAQLQAVLAVLLAAPQPNSAVQRQAHLQLVEAITNLLPVTAHYQAAYMPFTGQGWAP
jgi:hypothetical protein